MNTVIFETEHAVFEFDRNEVMQKLVDKGPEYDLDEVRKLLERISAESDESIVIPEDHNDFSFITLDLIETGKGSVTCRACGKTYKADQLKPIAVGCGGIGALREYPNI